MAQEDLEVVRRVYESWDEYTLEITALAQNEDRILLDVVQIGRGREKAAGLRD